MNSKWVTLYDGGEVDIGCLNCHARTIRCIDLPKVCNRCGCEMEDCRDEAWEYSRAEKGYVKLED